MSKFYIIVHKETREPLMFEVECSEHGESFVLHDGKFSINSGVWASRDRFVMDKLVSSEYMPPADIVSSIEYPYVDDDLMNKIAKEYEVVTVEV